MDLSGRLELPSDRRHASLGLEHAVHHHVAETGDQNEHGERLGVDATEQTSANVVHDGHGGEDRRAGKHDPAVAGPPAVSSIERNGDNGGSDVAHDERSVQRHRGA